MKNLFVITLIIGLVSCSEESPEPIKVSLELPDEPFEYLMESNAATLGRVLFYDKQLSINNSISCASCHKQSVAFSDNKRFSFGFENQITARNSMPIQNLLGGFSRTFEKENTDDVVEQSNFIDSRICCGGSSNLFWDGRAISSPESLLIPILNHVEMGIPSTKYLVNKVSSIRYYPDLFEKAFQEKSIDADKIALALHAFTNSINSNDTKLDQVNRGLQVLNAQETIGKRLFFEKYDCNSCHQVENPQGYILAGTFANIGLDQEYDDNGLGDFTELMQNNGQFKIPSLRNVAFTAPYMHDGRFATLSEVIAHYNTGLENHPNLDERLRNADGSPKRFHITPTETQAIISFLGTLSDENVLTDEKFANPFKVSK